jgi:predicted metal-dependent hydrolase
MEKNFDFGTRRISYNLTYKNRKTLGVKVLPDTTVEVIAPENTDESEVAKKVRAKAPWIIKQQDLFISFKPATPARRFVNGETHLYLGRQYKLKITASDTPVIKAYRGQFEVYSISNSKEDIAKQLEQWYKHRGEGVFNNILQGVLPLFKKYKIAEPQLYIRKMSKRWGSCTKAGKIILNTELIKAPKGSIEYVIIHELCHLVQRNHTKAFFALQDKIMPDWKKWKKRLEYCLA